MDAGKICDFEITIDHFEQLAKCRCRFKYKGTYRPSYDEVLSYIEDKYEIYLSLIPEMYVSYPKGEGINWNFQILWYNHDRTKTYGTYMFGDNHEYPTKLNAYEAALYKIIDIIHHIDVAKHKHTSYYCKDCGRATYLKMPLEVEKFECYSCKTKHRILQGSSLTQKI